MVQVRAIDSRPEPVPCTQVRAIDSRPELASTLYKLLDAEHPGADVRRTAEFLNATDRSEALIGLTSPTPPMHAHQPYTPHACSPALQPPCDPHAHYMATSPGPA